MSIAYEQLAREALEQIGVTTALAQLDSIAQQAAAKSWSFITAMELARKLGTAIGLRSNR